MSAGNNKTTVLVTGGSGYLARWCIRQLLDEDHEVRTTVRSPEREQELLELFAEPHRQRRLTVRQADLKRDEGWKEAVDGCGYVLHVASPFPPAQPRDPEELIAPAREGTARVMWAALDAGVQRIVVTSSSAAVRNAGQRPPGRPLTEDDWADASNPHMSPYAKSKVLAERTAWQLAAEAHQTERLSVVNPGAILGPLLGRHRSYSLQAIEQMLTGKMPAIPRLGFGFVDVRDVADLQIRAMRSPAATGQRFLGAGSFMWMPEIAAILRAELGERAAKVPRRTAPDFLVRLISRFDPEARSVIGDLGQRVDYSTEKAARLLDWRPRDLRESILDCANSIIGAAA